MVCGNVVHGDGGTADDDREQIVKIMGHSSSQLPDALQSLCLLILLLQPAACRDIRDRADHSGGNVLRCPLYNPSPALHPNILAGFLANAVLDIEVAVQALNLLDPVLFDGG